MANQRPTAKCSLISWVSMVLLTTIICGAQPSTNDLFVPPGSSVVLLVGIPGDLESEGTYHDQLQAWLEILELGAPDKVFVFWDNPDTINLPAKLQARVLKPVREEFLALGKTLAGQTNPLVLIAWGHGGMQGKTPVFHTRGPRLSPQDFKTLASEGAQAVSHWILAFRASGKFANELAAPNRKILSSCSHAA